MDKKELKRIDLKLNKLSKKLNFFIINPLNSKSEKKKFLRRKTYNPQFKYYKTTKDYGSVIETLSSIKTDDSALGKLFEDKKNSYISLANMLRSRGTDEFTKFSIELYGVPKKRLINHAKKFLKLKKEDEEKKITTEEIISILKKALEIYGLDTWKIREKHMTARAAVKGSTKKIFIKRNSVFSPLFLKRLIIHEIGTHVLRVENGSLQPFKIFKTGLPNYLMTEEGLAVINEEQSGTMNNYVLKNYAGRVIAVDISLRKSFLDTFNRMNKHFSKNAAWALTLRAKRGMRDTSIPGAFTKDHLYLKGYVELKNYIRKGGDVNYLYYGKVGVEHVPLMRKIKGLIKPKYLPRG